MLLRPGRPGESATIGRLVPRTIRLIPALCAFFVAAVAFTACGDDSVPGNSVARVGDNNIEKSTFDRWMKIALISTQGPPAGGSAEVSLPKPPDFTECIASARKAAPKPAKGQKAPTTAQYKTQCQQQYDGLRDQVMQFLINYEWVSGEAADQDIEVTDKAVDAEIAKTRKQSFPKDADFQKFLKQSGLTVEDIKFQVRLNQLQTKIREKIGKDAGKVTDAEIKAYYAKNRSRFAKPETRDLRLVLTKEQGRAAAAKAALQSGQSWSAAAKQYSIDQPTKGQGGVLKGIGKGQQVAELDKAVFGARKGQLVGPVKTQFGYYVFQVQKVVAPSQQSEKAATPAIRQLLSAQESQKAEQKFGKDFEKKWKGETQCQDDFKVPLCEGEKVPTQTAPPSGAGGGAAPPQQPQGGGAVQPAP